MELRFHTILVPLRKNAQPMHMGRKKWCKWLTRKCRRFQRLPQPAKMRPGLPHSQCQCHYRNLAAFRRHHKANLRTLALRSHLGNKYVPTNIRTKVDGSTQPNIWWVCCMCFSSPEKTDIHLILNNKRRFEASAHAAQVLDKPSSWLCRRNTCKYVKCIPSRKCEGLQYELQSAFYHAQKCVIVCEINECE